MNWIDWTLLTIFYILPATYWFWDIATEVYRTGKLMVGDLFFGSFMIFMPILNFSFFIFKISDDLGISFDNEFMNRSLWSRNDKPKT